MTAIHDGASIPRMKSKIPFAFLPVDPKLSLESGVASDPNAISEYQFSPHQWPLLRDLLGVADSEASKYCTADEIELLHEAESVDPLEPESCEKIAKALLAKYGTTNPALIVIWSWAKSRGLDVDPDNFDQEQSDEVFSAKHRTPENGFEVFGFDDGFECSLNPPGIQMSGLYGFDQLGEFIDDLDSIIKKPHHEWVYFWSDLHGVERSKMQRYVEAIKAGQN